MLSASKLKDSAFLFGSSHASLKVCKACHIPGDPATMHPSLFKGPATRSDWPGYAFPIVYCCHIL